MRATARWSSLVGEHHAVQQPGQDLIAGEGAGPEIRQQTIIGYRIAPAGW